MLTYTPIIIFVSILSVMAVLHKLTYEGFQHHFEKNIPIKPITWIVYLILGPLITSYYIISCIFWFFTIQINIKKVAKVDDKVPVQGREESQDK